MKRREQVKQELELLEKQMKEIAIKKNRLIQESNAFLREEFQTKVDYYQVIIKVIVPLKESLYETARHTRFWVGDGFNQDWNNNYVAYFEGLDQKTVKLSPKEFADLMNNSNYDIMGEFVDEIRSDEE